MIMNELYEIHTTVKLPYRFYGDWQTSGVGKTLLNRFATSIKDTHSIIIEVEKNDYADYQFMIGSKVRGTFTDVMKRLLEIETMFGSSDWSIVRQKVETTLDNPIGIYFDIYYETHLSVEVNEETLKFLRKFCINSRRHHLSRNVLKNDNVYILTRRSKNYIDTTNYVGTILQQSGIKTIKFEAEICLLDTNEDLDKMWLGIQ